MTPVIDFLITHTWWTFDPEVNWYARPYHWLNLIEGCFWLVFAGLVWTRYARHRRSRLELLYGLAFFTFALSDFREAYIVQSWLYLAKGINLFAILYLRSLIIRRYYPQARTF